MIRVAVLPSVLLAAALLASPLLAAPGGSPSVLRPSPDELKRTYARHDDVELERVSRRIGAPRLVALIERGSPDVQQAALAAVVLCDEGLQLLPRLVAFAGRADTPQPVAQQTLDAVRHVCERVTRGENNVEELPADLPRAVVEALATFAAREDRALPLRVSAVYALAALVPLVSSPQDLVQLASTKEVVVRRAVADALPSSAAPTLVKLITDDGDDAVAAAAAGVLCREVPPPGAERKNDRPLKRAVELPPAARVRLRALAVNEQLDEGARLDVIPCLRPGAQLAVDRKADLDVLLQLARGKDGSLKRRARAYGGH
ncbi:MAG: hypothetical protein ABI321_09875 [Polyangia bacterium]